MQYLTLEKESGAIQAVNMGLIGEEAECRWKDDEGNFSEYSDYLKLAWDDLEQIAQDTLQIIIPKPTIEDIRIGDTVRHSVLVNRGENYEPGIKDDCSFYVKGQEELDLLIKLFSDGTVLNIKLITRKSEGVDVSEE